MFMLFDAYIPTFVACSDGGIGIIDAYPDELFALATISFETVK